MELEEIRKKLEELFIEWRDEPVRGIRLMTGPGGMDLFSETMEEDYGMRRIYVAKVPRFARGLEWKESYTKGYYKLVKKSL